MKNLTWQNPEQLFVAQELINKVKSKCCGIKDKKENHQIFSKDIFQNISTQKEKKGKNLIATVAMRCIHCYPRRCSNVNETVRARNKILTTNIL